MPARRKDSKKYQKNKILTQIPQICSMFTGIIEAIGIIEEVTGSGSNISFIISSPISGEFKVDQSVSHDGVCLTVEECGPGRHKVTAIRETLEKTNLTNWEKGRKVNLERCLQMNGRLDGHLVQGHVDATSQCIARKELNGSTEFSFRLKEEFAGLIVEKGSVCINGISLTAFNVSRNSFSVAIIPFTMEHTNIGSVHVGDVVNIEFDILGKYVERMLIKKD